MLPRPRLKLLLCISLACFACYILSFAFYGRAHLPQPLRDYLAKPHPLNMWTGLIAWLVWLPVDLAATIGLFWGWRPARPLFLWASVASLPLCAAWGPVVLPASTAMFGVARTLVDGIIIGVLYYSPLKEL